ncbi:MAG TPA: type II 3-dehydroquinate dehydratase [Flavobacterium sp.]|nr:type II 3-dehydroquinate dehydratase [Flavobacterium sp.]
MKIGIINGPNLNLLGSREPSIYGNITFENFLDDLSNTFNHIKIDYFQSNHEGLLIDKLHEWGFDYDGIILNAGAYTHTSIALADAIKAINTPVVEVHISNIHNRESFRNKSFIAPVASGSISGFGLNSYKLALYALIES